MATLALPLITAALSGLSGLFGNRKSQQETSESWNQNSSGTQTPQYDPVAGAFRDSLIYKILDSLNKGNDQNYWDSYTRGALGKINTNSEFLDTILNSQLAARGIRGPAAGFAGALGTVNRLNQQAGVMNQIPLLQEEMRRANMGQALQLFGQIPYGTQTTQTSSGTRKGTNLQPGNQLGGLFGSLGSSLAYLIGRGAFGGQQGGFNGFSGTGSTPNASGDWWQG